MKRAIHSRPGDMAEYRNDFEQAIKRAPVRKPGFAESPKDLAVRFIVAVAFFIVIFTPIAFAIRFGLSVVGVM